MRMLKDRISRRLDRVGMRVDKTVIARLASYIELLEHWNTRMNLTTLHGDEEGLDRLIVEPLVAARYLPAVGRLTDIGSGGGSPAIPLGLACPGLQVRMVESKTRKTAFLREAIRHLDMGKVLVEETRYEELLTRSQLHESQEVVTVRAVRVDVAALRSLQALLVPGGVVALFRSSTSEKKMDGLQPPLVWEATYPLLESLRSELLLIRKLDIN
jgi:16S rRNA (guanine527-N7)-methyltransferase